METVSTIQLFTSLLIVPVFGYIISIEKRITRLETKIGMILENSTKRREKENVPKTSC